MLIVFSGLPGTGKTTIARQLAGQTKAVYLRIDTIEDMLSTSEWVRVSDDMGPAGYEIAIAIAQDNLRAGNLVIADSFNPIALSRAGYHQAAEEIGSPWFDVHIICSDKSEHRRRVENRRAQFPEKRLPGWGKVEQRTFEPWHKPDPRSYIELDTAELSAEDCVAAILERLRLAHA
jgi:predicted kinase